MARLFDEYPDVFDAYWLRITRDLGKEKPEREKFASRREATRAARIRKAARR